MVCLWSLMGQTFYRLSFPAISSLFSKTSHRKISMQILHTILYKFLKVLTRKISILMTRWRGLRGIMKVSDLGKLSYSRSVSLMFDHLPFCICCNFGIPTPCKISLHHVFSLWLVVQPGQFPLSSGYCPAVLDEEYDSTHFLATSKEWFFRGFSHLA